MGRYYCPLDEVSPFNTGLTAEINLLTLLTMDFEGPSVKTAGNQLQ